MPALVGNGRIVRARRGSFASIVGTGDFSMSCWVYPDLRSTSAAIFAQVGNNSLANNNGAWFQTQGVVATGWNFEFGRSTTNSGLYNAGVTLPFGRWYHLAVSHVGGTTDALPVWYLHQAGTTPDGTLAGPFTQSIFFSPAGTAIDPGTSGWGAAGGNFFGEVAHIQCWKRILTGAEFRQAMVAPGSVRAGQTLWVPFEKNGEERIQGYHGTAEGGARIVR